MNKIKLNIVKQSVSWEQIPEFGTLVAITCAGKTCYKAKIPNTKEKIESFVKGLIKKGHMSVIEHGSASIRIVCSRGLSHELVRHRIASFSQESSRYVNYQKKGYEVIKPLWIKSKDFQGYSFYGKQDKLEDIWEETITQSFQAYSDLLDGGVPPEYARGVLPIDLKTELVITANLREWRHIIQLRGSQFAHPQIQELAKDILKMFMDTEVRCIFEDIIL